MKSVTITINAPADIGDTVIFEAVGNGLGELKKLLRGTVMGFSLVRKRHSATKELTTRLNGYWVLSAKGCLFDAVYKSQIIAVGEAAEKFDLEVQ